jgi:hypothetical protein
LKRELNELRQQNTRLERSLAEAATQSADFRQKIQDLQVQAGFSLFWLTFIRKFWTLVWDGLPFF